MSDETKSELATACTIDGCENPPRPSGLCNIHYRRLLKYGDPLGLTADVVLAMMKSQLQDGEKPYIHPDFPRYRVTSLGRVFSLRSRKFLKPGRMGMYVGMQLVNAGGQLAPKKYLHRLVLEAVVGPCPSGMETRHLNGDKTDNRASNLTWGTPHQNAVDKRRHGSVATGARNPMAKLTDEQVREIRAMVRDGSKQRDACALFGVSPMTISRIIRRETWAEVA